MSKHHLCGYEVFLINFYGTNVFLGVGETEEDYVYVYEIDTYTREKDGETFEFVKWDNKFREFVCKDPVDCLIVPDNFETDNSYLGKALKIYPVELRTGAGSNIGRKEIFLPIKIEIGDKMFVEAGKNYSGLMYPGTYYAKKVCDGSNDSIRKVCNTGFKKMVTDWEELPQA